MGELAIQDELLNAFHSLTNRSWIVSGIHVVFDERAHHGHGKARLRDAGGVTL